MRYLSLFSGIEAASVAWEPLGWEPVAFCENDRFPSAVLAYRFPDVPNLGDITKVDWGEFKKQYGTIDLIVGGSPCQSFSIAGGRKSLGGESRLMFEYIRAVQEIRPSWFLWENVPGVLSTRDNAFEQLLAEMEKFGYGMAWATLDAQFFGVAQRRRRVFLVGCLRGGGASAAVLFERDSVRGNTKTSGEKRKELTRQNARSADGDSPVLNLQTADNLATTLTREYDASPCVDRGGYNVICVQDGQAKSVITQDNTSTTLNASHEQPIIFCAADDNGKTAINADLCGAMKVGGGRSLNSTGRD